MRTATGRDDAETRSMSEYQYYEFQAVDRRLTDREMIELRAYSTRATITSSRFVNHYEWGDFKGDPIVWMVKYFDAFLYVANPGIRWLMLRFPRERLDLRTARTYCKGRSASALPRGGFVILSCASEDDSGDNWDDDGAGWLASLITLRADVLAGDRRALYLAWLLCVQQGEVKIYSAPPPVPPGLGQLTASLTALADFLRLDGRGIAQAAQRSASVATDEDAHRSQTRTRTTKGLPQRQPPRRR